MSSPVEAKSSLMIDEPTAVTRHRMQRIRRTGTKPELSVRGLLRELGIHYRVAPKSLPGKPDLVNRRAGWAIFVHGCFWHGHEGCRLYKVPQTNSLFWQTKIEANRARDRRKAEALEALGLQVTTVWQCELSVPDRLRERLRTLLVR